MRGRKPQPAALRLARGLRPLHGGADMLPALSRPDCPGHLDELAVEEWKRITGELESANVLTALDRSVISAYCTAWSRHVRSEQAIRQLGEIIKSPTGYPIQNPHVSISNRALEIMNKAASELGLTPSSRSRIRTVPKPKTDALAAFLGETPHHQETA